MKKYKWGIIGPGKIARKFAEALSNVSNAELWAVASRDEQRAKQFAQQYGAKQFYGNYEAIANDADIDVVYIATPHSFHHTHALLCLKNRKPVLCEKPMSVNYQSTLQMVTAARENNVFLMEAMWTRFLPVIEHTLQLINDGEIGDVKFVRADFGVAFRFDPHSRIFDLKLGGGSLLDIGVYPLFLVLLLLGKPDRVRAIADLSVTGADETMNALLYYNDNTIASVLSTAIVSTPITAEIKGSKGSITIQAPWYKSSSLVLRNEENNALEVSLPYGDNGFEFEIKEVMNCIDQNLTESNAMPLDFSLMLSEVMNEISDQCNLKYEVQ
jgi:predicted dehydrogenase